MHSSSEALIYQIKILRVLVVGSFGQLLNAKTCLKEVLTAEQISRLSNLTHKLKTRGDSARVLLQTIDDGNVAGPAVVALAESIMSYIGLIKAEIVEAVTQEVIDAHSAACMPQIVTFTADLARSINSVKVQVNAASQRLPHVLKALVPTHVAFYYCLLAATNFAAGVKFDEMGLAKIVRELKFPAEYQQAGLSILNYFSAVLEDRYPDVLVGVSIQQYQDKVTLLITLPDGSQEIVEKLLTDYGLVVAGKLSARELMSNDVRALALQQKLELAQMEVRQTRDLLKLQEKYATGRIESLEQDVKNLYSLLGRELASKDELQRGFIELSLQSQNDQLKQQLSLLLGRLGDAIEHRDEQSTRIVLEDIKEADPDVFSKLSAYFYEAAATGVIGCAAFEWLKVILVSVAK